MSEADEKVKSTLKKPLICAEWIAVVPSYEEVPPYEDTATWSSKFYLKSVQCQFKLIRTGFSDGDLCLDLVRSDGLDITECFRCTVIPVSEVDLELPPPSIRESFNPLEGYLWQMEISDVEFERIEGNTISFLVVVEDGGSTQEQEEDEKSVQTSLPIDPIPCSKSLSEDWAKFLDTDTNFDVDFQCDEQSTKAHRLVVSARSPVLAKMLQSQMVEGTTGIIKIEDMDLDILRLFVRYLYTGRLAEAPTFETAMALYEAADKYGVKSLAGRCGQSLIEGLTVDNACDLLAVADAHGDQEMVEKVTVFVLENKMPISDDEPWSTFSDSHPKLAIKICRRFCKMICK